MRNWCRKVEIPIQNTYTTILIYLDVDEAGEECVKIKSVVNGMYLEESIYVSNSSRESFCVFLQNLSEKFLKEFVTHIAEGEGWINGN